MKRFAATAFLSLAVLLPPAAAYADDAHCAKVLHLLDASAAQSLFYRVANGQWAPVPAEGLALASRRVHLIYVIRELLLSEPRSGAVVVKTGRAITAGEPPAPIDKKISLHRPRKPQVDECTADGSPPFFRGRVAAREYDLYHDYGYDEEDISDHRTFSQFHTAYTGRAGRGRCRSSTASTTRDALLGDRRSNRSQFSFATDVVSGGVQSLIIAGFRFREAPPIGSVGLVDQRVEIIRYRTNGQRLACIPIGATLTGARFFVRVNDLEGRENGNPYTRIGEMARQLTR
jgi:hypothetical protein